MLIYAIVILLALVVAGMIYFVFVIPGQTQAEQRKQTSTPKQPVQVDDSASSQRGAPSTNASGIIICNETNLDCMVDASKGCSPAKANFIHSTTVSGIETTQLAFMEIKGMNGGNCEFYIKNEDTRIKFTDEKIGAMVMNGSTIEEITRLEMDADKSSKSRAGLDGTCKFKPGDLTLLLAKWNRDGMFEINSVASSCSGTLFGKAG